MEKRNWLGYMGMVVLIETLTGEEAGREGGG